MNMTSFKIVKIEAAQCVSAQKAEANVLILLKNKKKNAFCFFFLINFIMNYDA